MSNKVNTLSARIQKLEKRLRIISQSFASDPLDADDIFSEIVEAILNKCEPDFSDSMLLTKAKWTAYDHVNSVRIYTKYIGDADEIRGNDGDTFDAENSHYELDYAEVTISTFPNPEDALIASEEAAELANAIKQLSPTLQLIVSLLSRGYKPVEIANKLNISKSAVSQNIVRISEKLAPINSTI